MSAASDIAPDIHSMRQDVAAEAADFLLDRFDLLLAGTATEGDGHTVADTVVEEGIPCSHEQLSGGGVQVDDNGTTVTKSHKLRMPYTSTTVQITRHHKLRVHASGFNPEVIYEYPVQKLSGTAPLLTVFATLTSEGYRRPGVG